MVALLLFVLAFFLVVFHFGRGTLFVVCSVFCWNKGKSFMPYLFIFGSYIFCMVELVYLNDDGVLFSWRGSMGEHNGYT